MRGEMHMHMRVCVIDQQSINFGRYFLNRKKKEKAMNIPLQTLKVGFKR